ncbi:MAG: hypothetical protein ACJ746_11960 [Bryobacteraceae bacterium]
MRSVLSGLLPTLVAACSAPASVMYSFSQSASPPGVYPWPAISFNFTVPSLLTKPTEIPASSLNSTVSQYMGHDLSALDVGIDPGMNSGTYFVNSGVPSSV